MDQKYFINTVSGKRFEISRPDYEKILKGDRRRIGISGGRIAYIDKIEFIDIIPSVNIEKPNKKVSEKAQEPEVQIPEKKDETGLSGVPAYISETVCPKCGKDMELRYLVTSQGKRYQKQCVSCLYRTRFLSSTDAAKLVDDLNSLKLIE